MQRSLKIIGAAAMTITTAGAGAAALSGTAGAAATSNAKAEYQAALKAAGKQNVHYISNASEQGVTLKVTGDTGKTSGSQELTVKSGKTVETLKVVLIGTTGYMRGNATALQSIIGLTAAEAGAEANQWISFPASNTTLAQLVSGLRDQDVATELEMTGPYTTGTAKSIKGQSTDAINGFASTSSGTKVPIVLYVDASGTPRPVEEITNPAKKGTAIRGTVTFSKWGETTSPKAPSNPVPLSTVEPAG